MPKSNLQLPKSFTVRIDGPLLEAAEQHARKWSSAAGISITVSDLIRIGLRHVLEGCGSRTSGPLPAALPKTGSR
jgi:hypothetical protein